MTITIQKLIRDAIEARLASVHVALPAKIVKLDAQAHTVSVQPMVSRKVEVEDPSSGLGGQFEFENLSQIDDVPIGYVSTGTGYILPPLRVGDFVQLVFNELDTGEFMETGKLSNPLDGTMHGTSYPVAYPVFCGPNKANKAISGSNLQMDADGEIHLGSNATEFAALANLVLSELSAIQTWANAHVHTNVTTGPGSTGTPAVTMPAPSSVAASKVKVE